VSDLWDPILAKFSQNFLNSRHILASASVDKTVILWDIEKAKPELRLKEFTDKVQTIAFHPTEAEYLLTGSSDKTVKLFDCRQSDNEAAQFKKWELDGEVEKIKWNVSDKHYFFVGTNDGKIAYYDSRGAGEPVWSVDAHEKEVTDFGVNPKAPEMLTSTSVDGLVKIWKFDNSNCNLIQSHHYKLGRIHCLDECPENPFVFVIGGDKRKKNMTVVNSLDFENVKKEFTNLTVEDSRRGDVETEEMEEDED
jgi:periodic tryptophan protein 1